MKVSEKDDSMQRASKTVAAERQPSGGNAERVAPTDPDDNSTAREKSEQFGVETPKDSVDVDDKAFEPPDGGFRAWLCVFGSFLLQFSSFGYVNA